MESKILDSIILVKDWNFSITSVIARSEATKQSLNF